MISQQMAEVPFLDLKAQYLSIKDEIAVAIDEVLSTAHYVGGEIVARFESSFAAYVGVPYCVGVSSGTAALELALKTIQVLPGDEVIVPANSFFATAEAVSNVGAIPVFCDVDPVTFHLTADTVEPVLTSRTVAIIPVHLYGRALRMDGIEELAKRKSLRIIEDAAQAHGSELNGRRVGASGRLTCFSMYPGKNLGAYGEAGAVTTSDPAEAETLQMLREHGSKIKYEHPMIGTNARLDAIQAAVLSTKLRHLDGWNDSRRKLAARYARTLDGTLYTLPEHGAPKEHNFHLYVVRHPRRDALRKYLAQLGIGVGIHYPIPLHLTGAYWALGARGGSLPGCRDDGEGDPLIANLP